MALARRWLSAVGLLSVVSFTSIPAAYADPPFPPVINEPPYDGALVSAQDVHMEIGPFQDPDPGDTHFCTDWEIHIEATSEEIWSAECVTGLDRTHIHLGDGTFEGSYAGQTSLDTDTNYRLRVRVRDSSGLWSDYSERLFLTGPPSQVFPMLVEDIATTPVPAWIDTEGQPIVLPPGNPAPRLRLGSATGELLLEIRGLNGSGNTIINPPSLSHHEELRASLTAGSFSLPLPQSSLRFFDQAGNSQTIYLPPVTVSADSSVYFWISTNGSSFWAAAEETEPDFSQLAQGSPVPWTIAQPGYKVEVVATGFQLPVNIAFVPNPGPDPGSPYFYVTELYGSIKVVTRDFTVHDYATGLLNFDPGGDFPGSGEQGLAGIVVDPANGDIYAGMLYDAQPPNGPHYPKVCRFTSNDGGLTASTQTTILDMPGEVQGQSHFISNFTLGPDGKLYVHMGDGFAPGLALILDSFRGKILRLNLDGSAPSDNPFYQGPQINARDYVFAYGFRNPFGGVWRASDGEHYEVENGPYDNDRFAKVLPGTSYGWNGAAQSMTINALFNWSPTHAPVNIAYVQPQTFGGSGFPATQQDRAFVTESGPTWAQGPQPQGKRIVEFAQAADGAVLDGPRTLVEYNGSGRATACGLAAGPDGLYFSDLYKDQDYDTPVDRGANILRVKYVGTVDFAASPSFGFAPLIVDFTDYSDVSGPTAWWWEFGDGESSALQNPEHTYAQDGAYTVRLEVTGQNGIQLAQKDDCVIVGTSNALGLLGDYYNEMDFTEYVFSRIDPTVNFTWGYGSPDPRIHGEQFAIRWTGQVLADYSETYRFYTTTDDGVRLWVDDQLIVDAWVVEPPTEHNGTISLQAGVRYNLIMEYFEDTFTASARLEWSSPSRTRQAVPQSHLYPAFLADVNGGRREDLAQISLVPLVAPNPLPGIGSFLVRSRDGGPARLCLYDPAGREVAQVFRGRLDPAGSATANLDPRGLATGIYFLRLESGGATLTRKITVVH